MRDAANDSISFVRHRERAELDTMQWLGLVKCLEIIGEAATRISLDFRLRYPEIPWVLIAGMRHRLVHAYDEINFDVVWSTATEDLPPLVTILERILTTWTEPTPDR